MSFLIEHKIGEVSYETEHKFLFHLCDSHSFSYTVDTNALCSYREKHVSTTYDPDKNYVFGYYHHNFKFVLNAKRLIKDYGGYEFDFYTRVGDKRKSLNEKEIRINTDKIENFNRYLIGTVLLFDIFSQKSIQSLLYDNNSSKGLFDPKAKDYAPQAVVSLYKHMFVWQKPIWIGSNHRSPTLLERQFIKDAYDITQRGGKFKDGMLELSDKYSVVDFNGIKLNKLIVIRRELAKKIRDSYNKYFQDRPYEKVSPTESFKLFKNGIRTLFLGDNAEKILLSAAQNLFHPAIRPVDWSIIYRELYNGDIEAALEAIEWVYNDRKWHIEHYDKSPDDRKYMFHAGSYFG